MFNSIRDIDKIMYKDENMNAFGLPYGMKIPILSPRFSNLQNKLISKAWDPREANLMTYQMNRLPPSELVNRIQNVKAARFYKRPIEQSPVLQYGKITTEAQHLNTDNPRPAPFPHLMRPKPPPFPLPTFEGGTLSAEELPAVPSPVRKIPSFVREISQEGHYDADKLDAERKYRSLLEAKPGKTKINLNPNYRFKKVKPPLPIAEQTKNWELHLRDFPPFGKLYEDELISDESEQVPFKPAPKLRRPKWPVQLPLPPLDDTLQIVAAQYKNSEEILQSEEEEAKKQLEDNTGFEMSAYFQLPPRGRLLPNQTVKAVEKEMEHVAFPCNFH